MPIPFPPKLLSWMRVPTMLEAVGTIDDVDAPSHGPAECTALHCGVVPAEASNQQPQPSVVGSHHCHTEHVPSACLAQQRFSHASADVSASLACVRPSHCTPLALNLNWSEQRSPVCTNSVSIKVNSRLMFAYMFNLLLCRQCRGHLVPDRAAIE